jgi:hypothetical protein
MWKGVNTITDADHPFGRSPVVRISAEHGLGDTFLMARYIPEVLKRGVKVIFEVQKPMIDLMRFNFPDVTCIEFGASGEDIDYHLPMMSLPFVLKSKKAHWGGAYLKADPASLEKWSEYHPDARLGEIKLCRPLIGIVWAGGKRSYNAENNETNRRRSVPFELIAPLLKTEGVNFVSLQVDEQEPFPNPGIKDFSDTAAIIRLCDVVITVDSSVANLAGAMAKPVWLLNRYDSCWRWVNKCEWYPTAIDYRQTKPNDWSDVLEKVQFDLNKFRDKMAQA